MRHSIPSNEPYTQPACACIYQQHLKGRGMPASCQAALCSLGKAGGWEGRRKEPTPNLYAERRKGRQADPKWWQAGQAGGQAGQQGSNSGQACQGLPS